MLARQFLRTLAVSLLPILAGCAGPGPLPESAALNPYYWQQWKKDEEAGPTFHTRLADYRDLQSRAPRMPLEEQEQLALRLAQLLSEEGNPLLRREIVVTLGRLSTPAASGPLRAALADTDPGIRVAACRAWGRRGNAESIVALSSVLTSDENLDVRLAATQELANFAGPQAVQALSIALADQDPALQYSAVQSLKSATGRDYGNDVAAWQAFVQGQDVQPRSPSLVDRARELF